MDPRKCICGGTSFISIKERGEIICKSCGNVVHINIDAGPEWTHEKSGQNTMRGGSPLTLLESDLGLTSPFGAFELSSSGLKTGKARRMRQIQFREISPIRRRMDKLLNEIKSKAELLQLARHELETAAQLARKALITDEKKRWNTKALAVASIYLSYRLNDNPQKIADMLKTINSPKPKKKDVSKVVRALLTVLNVRAPLATEERTIKRVAKHLRPKKEILMTSMETIKIAKKHRIGLGKNPGSLAAAAIYISYKLHGSNITQKKICKAANTTEVTLRSRVKDIISNITITINV